MSEPPQDSTLHVDTSTATETPKNIQNLMAPTHTAVSSIGGDATAISSFQPDPNSAGDGDHHSPPRVVAEGQQQVVPASTTTTYTYEALQKGDYWESPLRIRNSNREVSKEEPAVPVLSSLHSPNVLLGVLVIFVLLQAVIMGCWIYLYNLITSSMPHTFSWLALLSPMGSMLTESCAVEEDGPCKVLTTPPYLILAGLVLEALQLFNAAVFLGIKMCRGAFIFYVKLVLYLQTLFFVFGAPICSSLLYISLHAVEGTMRKGLDGRKSALRAAWDVTQSRLNCCGITNHTDWNYVYSSDSPYIFALRSGEAVCDSPSPGCYDLEHGLIVFYGHYTLLLIPVGLLTSLVFFITARRYQDSTKEWPRSNKSEENSPSHRIFIRQGSHFTAFGGQGRHSHVIRKDGILVEATGALAGSTGMNENLISMEILGYSEKRRETVDVCRESERIVITVTRQGQVRGKATVMAKDPKELEKVRVNQTRFGLNISLGSEASAGSGQCHECNITV